MLSHIANLVNMRSKLLFAFYFSVFFILLFSWMNLSRGEVNWDEAEYFNSQITTQT